MDIPRIFNITESAHRIHNPFTPEKLATLGAALRLEPESRVLDLGSGSGEMLCTWAIGFGAFMYGKKLVLYKPMIIGIALMAYPYFVPQTWLPYSIGCALCVGLYIFRE